MFNSQIRVGDIVQWLKMTQSQVLSKFMTLEGAYTDGKKDCSFVYVPGTRPDRVLLVAHADTVFGENHIPKIGMHSGVLFSMSNSTSGKVRSRSDLDGRQVSGTGIGADDRAGCAIVWKLRNSGHSILITCGEEVGQVAAHKIMENEWWKKEISSHQFAVQFDRRGYKDIVFYQCGTFKFKDYVEEETCYDIKTGSRTDICVLCEDICGVNISVGYYNEHTSNEILVLDQWFNTYLTVKKWLSQKDLPKFETIKNQYGFSGGSYHNNYHGYDDNDELSHWEQYTQRKSIIKTGEIDNSLNDIKEEAKKIIQKRVSDPIIFCEHCGTSRNESTWINCSFKCPTCKIPQYHVEAIQ